MKQITGLVVGICLGVIPVAAHTAPIYADTVVSFSGGAGFGVIDQSGGAYTGASGVGVFDPLAVTQGLDGAALALGGQSGAPGVIVVSFGTGSVIDGPGSDLRIFDTFGLSESLTVEASENGSVFVPIGSFPGDFSQLCSPSAPCGTDFDLALSGLGSASFFRITAAPQTGCVLFYPECYDLDAVEALQFSASSVPEPGGLALFGIALAALTFSRRKRAQV